MPIVIGDTLLRDPAKESLVNNGQARITGEGKDANVEKELRGELSTFVCEGKYYYAYFDRKERNFCVIAF